ncbi:hypothetical protein [Rhodoferax sp. WC2427]|uniref:hypothetical protein n=1 Tax=Rhodoferax sp. WC2427 TaxID=3234144 RepID=UPI003465C5BC
MYSEAQDRLHDADLLAASLNRMSNSESIIRILAFEVLLKAALLVSRQEPKQSHNYRTLWLGMPGYARKEILAFASERMPGLANLSQIEKFLFWYQYIFEKSRYHYELYDGYTLAEQNELGQSWLETGARTEDAVVQYYPLELECLIAGLKAYIENAL